MQKILVLAYFFPPCNLTASQRAFGWARSLNKFGYYPIIITRSWDNRITQPEDVFIKSGNGITIKKEDGYEVHFMPYTPSIRDKIFMSKKKNIIFSLIRKLFSFSEIISYKFSNVFISYKNIYYQAKKILESDRSINKMIVTANPYPMFKFGYLLKKEFNIKWIADYRDDWYTNILRYDLRKGYSSFSMAGFVRYFEKKSELKWVTSASLITSISEHYVDRISTFLNVKGQVLLNGFIKDDFRELKEEESENFTIIYNGTLYDTQPIEDVLEAVKLFIDKNRDISLKVLFIGTSYVPEQEKRILAKAGQLNIIKYIEVTPRIPRTEVLRIQKSTHILLMVLHKGSKGVSSSKLYEYLAIGKPVVSYPPDSDIVDETLNGYNLGYVCRSKEQIVDVFESLFDKYLHGTYSKLIADKDYVDKFSRLNQTEILSNILSEL